MGNSVEKFGLLTQPCGIVLMPTPSAGTSQGMKSTFAVY